LKISPPLAQQAGMIPLLNDLSLVNHQYAAGGAYGGQSMGHHEADTAMHDLVYALLDQALAVGIDRGSGFVQDEDIRVRQHCPGQ